MGGGTTGCPLKSVFFRRLSDLEYDLNYYFFHIFGICNTGFLYILGHFSWKGYALAPVFAQIWLQIWFMDNNIDPEKAIFTNDKEFTLRPYPNQQNRHIWSVENPFEYDDCVEKGAATVMCLGGSSWNRR